MPVAYFISFYMTYFIFMLFLHTYNNWTVWSDVTDINLTLLLLRVPLGGKINKLFRLENVLNLTFFMTILTRKF